MKKIISIVSICSISIAMFSPQPSDPRAIWQGVLNIDGLVRDIEKRRLEAEKVEKRYQVRKAHGDRSEYENRLDEKRQTKSRRLICDDKAYRQGDLPDDHWLAIAYLQKVSNPKK